MNISNCKGYELVKQERLKELNSTGYLVRHKKTKARIVLLENDDDNKVFHIGFRTIPKDSTGVAHIVEHTVLCGSRDFPVKDPFIELEKGSLNTFLNAMTYPDKTVYPVASCNDKDFQNLMHVYLDAVFYPNIYKEEKIFRQEGWHYELTDEEGDLTYNGVVFNEMKGVFSSPKQLLDRNIQQSLFPDTCYGVESGGDPEVIPDLSYEQYLDFHRTYYHPSNSYLYLYGDMDMEEKLNWIDEKYLSHFEASDVESEITLQKPFKQMREEYGFYSVTEGEETEGKAYFSYNAVCGDVLDRNLYRAFQILAYVLVQSVGAPLKQALLDAGLGNDISCYYEESIRQPYFSIIAKNVRMEQKEAFLKTIREELTKIVKEGLNPQSLRAAINGLEFQCKEADFSRYPKGLMYGLQIFDSWLYDDNQPFIHICSDDTFDFLKSQVETGYFEEIIKKYFLENTHTSFVSVQPKVGLTARMDEEERKRLQVYKATLSQEEKRKMVKETEALKAYQEEPTPSENLRCIPLLEREDIGRKAQPYVNEEKKMGDISILHHPVFTNGITYFRFVFDVQDLKEYTPYLSLLSDVLAAVDTDEHDKLALSNEILLHSGGISTDFSVYADYKSDDYHMLWEIGGKTLYGETQKTLELVREILTSSHLNDTKRLREIIAEVRSVSQMGLQSAGHSTAILRAMSYIKESTYYREQIRGISYYEFLCELDDNFEEHEENLVAVLEALLKKILTKNRILVDITADEKGCEVWEKAAETIFCDLPEMTEMVMPEPMWKLLKPTKNEGFKTAGKVQYVARAGSYKENGIAYDGISRVVRTILSYDYLWNEVRVKGGAYGVMCSFAPEGIGYMVSYRDPNLTETNQVYEEIPDYLQRFDVDEREMMKYIIGTISELDTPLTPRQKGIRSFGAYIKGVTWEDVQKEREEVLSATPEKVRRAAEMIKAILSDGYICVLGSEEKIQQAQHLFDVVQVLN